MGNIGAPEIVLLLLVALLLFGAKRLPEIGRSLGTGMREFKDSVTGTSSPTETTTKSWSIRSCPGSNAGRKNAHACQMITGSAIRKPV
jgi:sec-independent protein translocase protein TatA